MNKYHRSNSKHFFFSYNCIFDDNIHCFDSILKEIKQYDKDIIYGIIGNGLNHTYCFINVNKRLQVCNRFFLSLNKDGKEIIPCFYRYSKKSKMIKFIESKKNVYKYNI